MLAPAHGEGGAGAEPEGSWRGRASPEDRSGPSWWVRGLVVCAKVNLSLCSLWFGVKTQQGFKDRIDENAILQEELVAPARGEG